MDRDYLFREVPVRFSLREGHRTEHLVTLSTGSLSFPNVKIEDAMRKRTASADIARLTGVSCATVSYVINGRQDTRISSETRDWILTAAKKNGYRRNRLAAALSTGRTNIIGVVTHPTDSGTGVLSIVRTCFWRSAWQQSAPSETRSCFGSPS